MNSFRIGQWWFSWMGGKVRTDFLPVITSVTAFPDVLSAVIQHTRVLRRKNDGGRNCASKVRISNPTDGAHAKIDALRAPCFAIHFLQKSQGAVHEYDVGIGRIKSYETRLPTRQWKPIKVGDLSERASTGDRKRTAVLLASVYPVGIAVVSSDLVDLGCFLVVPRTPGLTTIETDRCPLIAAVHDMVRVSGINPPLIRVITAGRTFKSDQCTTAVGGSVDTGTHRIDHIRIMRIHQNLFARGVNTLGGHRPTRATVVRPVKPCAVQQVYAPGMSAYRDCSLPE